MHKFLIILFLSGCALTPPDAEICLWLPEGEGYCTYTMRDVDRLIPAEEWQNMQVGRFSMTAEDFAEYQIFVEQACEVAKCTAKEKKAQEKVLSRIRSLNESLHRLD